MPRAVGSASARSEADVGLIFSIISSSYVVMDMVSSLSKGTVRRTAELGGYLIR